MLGNDWRITKILLAKRPRDPRRLEDRRLKWFLYSGLLASSVVISLVWAPYLKVEEGFSMYVHIFTAIAVILPVVFLPDYPAGARFSLIVLLGIASGIITYLIQVPEYLAVMIPFFVVCLGVSGYAIFQIRSLGDT